MDVFTVRTSTMSALWSGAAMPLYRSCTDMAEGSLLTKRMGLVLSAQYYVTMSLVTRDISVLSAVQ